MGYSDTKTFNPDFLRNVPVILDYEVVNMANTVGKLALYIGILAIPLGFLYNAYFPVVQRTITVFGIHRQPAAVKVASSGDMVLLENTMHCEDLHYYAPTHELYTACEDSLVTRFSWFPPLTEFNASVISQARAGLFIINPDVSVSGPSRIFA